MESNSKLQRRNFQSIRDNLKTQNIFRTNTQKAIVTSEIKSSIRKNPKSSFNNQSDAESVDLEEDLQQIERSHIQGFVSETAFEQKFQLIEKLGEGSNGVVKKCRQIKTNQIYAVKISSIDEEHVMVLRQIYRAVKSLDEPSIIKYKGLYINKKKHMCYLVMEYVPYPSLRKFKDLNEDEVKSIIKQLLKATKYMHKRYICHRDIKLDNILYNRQTGKIKIIDFGISKKTMERGKIKQMWSPTGTIGYKAPEMLSGGGYNESVDIWAIGVILYELITGTTPFHCEYLTDEIQKITSMQYKIEGQCWSKFSKFAKDLVQKLLRDAKSRFTAEQALRTPWLLQNNSGLGSGQLATTSELIPEPEFILMRNKTKGPREHNFEFHRMHSMNMNGVDSYVLEEIEKLRNEDEFITDQ